MDELSISFSGEASENFEKALDGMYGWIVRITPREGEPFDAVLARATPDDEVAAQWLDSVTFQRVDLNDAPVPDSFGPLESTRVRDVYVY